MQRRGEGRERIEKRKQERSGEKKEQNAGEKDSIAK